MNVQRLNVHVMNVMFNRIKRKFEYSWENGINIFYYLIYFNLRDLGDKHLIFNLTLKQTMQSVNAGIILVSYVHDNIRWYL